MTRDEQLARYKLLMIEIKERSLSVLELAKLEHGINRFLAKEFCFLLLRFTCECIALACLTAHEDITKESEGFFKKKYQADVLIKRLAKLHPNFYPHPVHLRIKNEVEFEFADKRIDYLTRDELVKLVSHCGDRLHRGNVKKYVFREPDAVLDMEFESIVIPIKNGTK